VLRSKTMNIHAYKATTKGYLIVAISISLTVVIFGLASNSSQTGYAVEVNSNSTPDHLTVHPSSSSGVLGISDSDGDGLPDSLEPLFNCDPNNSDSDGDGRLDGDEVLSNSIAGNVLGITDNDMDGLSDAAELIYGTDPNNPDTDNDGTIDSQEIINGTSPTNNDTDGDGLTDDLENSNNTEPRNIDTDDDTINDLQETILGTSPTNNDTDGDGVDDGEEIENGTDPLDQDEWKKPFKFSAVGDIGSSVHSKNMLDRIDEDAEFSVILGDFSYEHFGGEEIWCDFAKSTIPDHYPFELVIGNHEDGTGSASSQSDWAPYEACLPSKVPGLVGDYGIQSYFDYNDLVRVISISPGVANYGSSYGAGSPEYNWTRNAITSARSNGIEWVVVSMHKNCLVFSATYPQSCEIGPDIYNLLHQEEVDLILQGHEHAYNRSKQLKLSSACPQINPGSFNPACVSNGGSVYEQGLGTTTIISGLGGRSNIVSDPTDPEANYFENITGTYVGLKSAYSHFEVSQDQIAVKLVPTSGGGFNDSFVINR